MTIEKLQRSKQPQADKSDLSESHVVSDSDAAKEVLQFTTINATEPVQHSKQSQADKLNAADIINVSYHQNSRVLHQSSYIDTVKAELPSNIIKLELRTNSVNGAIFVVKGGKQYPQRVLPFVLHCEEVKKEFVVKLFSKDGIRFSFHSTCVAKAEKSSPIHSPIVSTKFKFYFTFWDFPEDWWNLNDDDQQKITSETKIWPEYDSVNEIWTDELQLTDDTKFCFAFAKYDEKKAANKKNNYIVAVGMQEKKCDDKNERRQIIKILYYAGDSAAIPNPKPICSLIYRHNVSISAMAFNCNATLLVSGCMTEIRIWSINPKNMNETACYNLCNVINLEPMSTLRLGSFSFNANSSELLACYNSRGELVHDVQLPKTLNLCRIWKSEGIPEFSKQMPLDSLAGLEVHSDVAVIADIPHVLYLNISRHTNSKKLDVVIMEEEAWCKKKDRKTALVKDLDFAKTAIEFSMLKKNLILNNIIKDRTDIKYHDKRLFILKQEQGIIFAVTDKISEVTATKKYDEFQFDKVTFDNDEKQAVSYKTYMDERSSSHEVEPPFFEFSLVDKPPQTIFRILAFTPPMESYCYFSYGDKKKKADGDLWKFIKDIKIRSGADGTGTSSTADELVAYKTTDGPSGSPLGARHTLIFVYETKITSTIRQTVFTGVSVLRLLQFDRLFIKIDIIPKTYQSIPVHLEAISIKIFTYNTVKNGRIIQDIYCDYGLVVCKNRFTSKDGSTLIILNRDHDENITDELAHLQFPSTIGFLHLPVGSHNLLISCWDTHKLPHLQTYSIPFRILIFLSRIELPAPTKEDEDDAAEQNKAAQERAELRRENKITQLRNDMHNLSKYDVEALVWIIANLSGLNIELTTLIDEALKPQLYVTMFSQEVTKPSILDAQNALIKVRLFIEKQLRSHDSTFNTTKFFQTQCKTLATTISKFSTPSNYEDVKEFFTMLDPKSLPQCSSRNGKSYKQYYQKDLLHEPYFFSIGSEEFHENSYEMKDFNGTDKKDLFDVQHFVLPFCDIASPNSTFLQAFVASAELARDSSLLSNICLQAVIDFKWKKFGRTYFIRRALLYIVGLILLVSWSMFRSYRSSDSTNTNLKSYSSSKDVLQMVFAILTMVVACIEFLVFNLFIQIKVATKSFGQYVYDFWNLIDIIHFVLSCICFATFCAGSEFFDVGLAYAVFFRWFGILYYLQPFKPTGPLIRMISQIIIDIRWFVFVLAISIFAVANSFFVLLNPQRITCDSNDPTIGGCDVTLTKFQNPGTAIFYSFTMLILGGFDWKVDDFLQGDWQIAVQILFSLAMVFITIVLLNLLIAIMGNGYDTIQMEAAMQLSLIRAKMILKQEAFMNHDRNKEFFPAFLHVLLPVGSTHYLFKGTKLQKATKRGIRPIYKKPTIIDHNALMLNDLQKNFDEVKRRIALTNDDISKNIDEVIKQVTLELKGHFENQLQEVEKKFTIQMKDQTAAFQTAVGGTHSTNKLEPNTNAIISETKTLMSQSNVLIQRFEARINKYENFLEQGEDLADALNRLDGILKKLLPSPVVLLDQSTGTDIPLRETKPSLTRHPSLTIDLKNISTELNSNLEKGFFRLKAHPEVQNDRTERYEGFSEIHGGKPFFEVKTTENSPPAYFVHPQAFLKSQTEHVKVDKLIEMQDGTSMTQVQHDEDTLLDD